MVITNQVTNNKFVLLQGLIVLSITSSNLPYILAWSEKFLSNRCSTSYLKALQKLWEIVLNFNIRTFFQLLFQFDLYAGRLIREYIRYIFFLSKNLYFDVVSKKKCEFGQIIFQSVWGQKISQLYACVNERGSCC